MIEFSHRLSSGLALLLVVGLLIWAFRAYPRGDRVRLGATLSLVFMVSEALIGAGLVLFELVAHNDSLARILSLALHLMNTFLLLAALTITGWWASGGGAVRLRGQGAISWMLGLAFIGVLGVGMTGAVTALGDTLFPSTSLSEGLRQDFNPTAHFLIRLRVIHPLLAVSVGLYTILTAALVSALRRTPMTNRFAQALAVLYVLQLCAGALNLVLLAPVWLQMVHLLLADMVWIALVLLTASACVQTTPQVEPVSVPPAWGSART
jgi:heme A synthase